MVNMIGFSDIHYFLASPSELKQASHRNPAERKDSPSAFLIFTIVSMKTTSHASIILHSLHPKLVEHENQLNIVPQNSEKMFEGLAIKRNEAEGQRT